MGPDAVCYFCFKKRRRADMNFVKMARKVFDLRDVEDDAEKEIWGREGVHLYVVAQRLVYEETGCFRQN